MYHNYCIIGTGRQGTAAAYDLIKYAKIKNLLLLDTSPQSINECLYKLKPISQNINIKTKTVDIDKKDILINTLMDYDIFLSSVPYEYNLMLTKVALLSSTSMVDLGGHTENVIKQLDYDKEAKKKKITIVPDCGMGPGMNVSMALLGIEKLDIANEVFIWDGGLPKNPKEPWNYSLFFNIKGLTNEYDESAFFLDKGRIKKVPCFEGIEIIDFGDDIVVTHITVEDGWGRACWGDVLVVNNKIGDLLFVGAFIVVAVLTSPKRGGSSAPCNATRYTAINTKIPSSVNCNLPWGTFILAILST